MVIARAKEYGYDGVEVRAFLNEAVLTAANVFLTDLKKVRAIFKSRIFGANKPKPCFMDEGGGLKSLPGRFTSHFAGGESTQFIVEEVKKLISGLGVALLHRS